MLEIPSVPGHTDDVAGQRARVAAGAGRAPSRLGATAQKYGIVAAAFMVWAGQVKQIPPLSSLPVDFTLAMTGLALICGLVFSLAAGSSIRRDPLLVSVLVFGFGVVGAFNFVASDYAADKTLRFFLLTWPSALAIALLTRNQDDTARFLKAVIAVAFGLSLFIAIGGEREFDESLGRLTTPEGDTILFGQACGAVVIAVAAWLLTSKRLTVTKVAAAGALVAFEIWTMLAIASKGPVQAVVLGAAAVFLLQLRRLNPKLAGRIFAIIAVGIVALIGVWSRVPLWSRERILEFSSGGSANARFRSWSFTWSNLDASPFGNGWGSWDQDSPIAIGHPHNIILEIWYEAGLLGLIAIIAAVGVASVRLLAVYDVDRKRATLGFGLVMFWFMAAQVSSDINGNKLLFGVLVATAAPLAYRQVAHADSVSSKVDVEALVPIQKQGGT